MEMIRLNNGVEMPMLGLGTFLTSGDDCAHSVCTAIQAGYRLIDTAEAYGNEAQVGVGIQQSGIDRKELFLVTKVNFKSYENTREKRYENCRRADRAECLRTRKPPDNRNIRHIEEYLKQLRCHQRQTEYYYFLRERACRHIHITSSARFLFRDFAIQPLSSFRLCSTQPYDNSTYFLLFQQIFQRCHKICFFGCFSEKKSRFFGKIKKIR